VALLGEQRADLLAVTDEQRLDVLRFERQHGHAFDDLFGRVIAAHRVDGDGDRAVAHGLARVHAKRKLPEAPGYCISCARSGGSDSRTCSISTVGSMASRTT